MACEVADGLRPDLATHVVKTMRVSMACEVADGLRHAAKENLCSHTSGFQWPVKWPMV